ncbi:hypothetical protein [Renibacterium salmoninarum]|nr:hypothetical protein [Renibacterium salmoninarum]
MPGSISSAYDRRRSVGFALSSTPVALLTTTAVVPQAFNFALVTLSAQIQIIWDAKASPSGYPGWGEAYGRFQIGAETFLAAGPTIVRQETDADGKLSRVVKSLSVPTALIQLRGQDLAVGSTIEGKIQLWCSAASNTPAGYHSDPDMTCDLMMQVHFIR